MLNALHIFNQYRHLTNNTLNFSHNVESEDELGTLIENVLARPYIKRLQSSVPECTATAGIGELKERIIKLFRAGKLDEVDKLDYYIQRAALSELRRAGGKGKKVPTAYSAGDEFLFDGLVSNTPNNDEPDPRLAVLHCHLESLPAGYQTMVRMKYLEGFDNKEIATVLGISVGTVKSQLFHGLRRLREAYQQ